MLNSRKLRNALALGGLLVMGAASSFAQVNCTLSAPSNVLRPEGLAEPTGTIGVNNCSQPLTAATVINVTVSAPIVNNATIVATATSGTATVTGTVAGNVITFSFAGTTGQGSSATISGIRVNASGLAAYSPVTASLFMTVGSESASFTGNPVQIGAALTSSFAFSVVGGTSAGATDSGAVTLTNCTSPTNATVQGFLRFRENFAGTLKSQASEGGSATNPTQIRFQFTNIPSGVTVYLPSTAISTGNNTLTPVSGVSSTAADDIDATYTPAGADIAYNGNFGAVAAGTDAVYSVTVDSLGTIDSLYIPFIVRYSSTSGLGAVSVAGSLAPQAENTAPRFTTAGGDPMPAFSVGACVTSLLFPYVTNYTGWDTGFAIVNTSKDAAEGTPGLPFSTPGGAGTCTLSFFGRNAEDASRALPPAITTPEIAAGGVWSGSLSSANLETGYQGYVIAQCNFRLAHGYAFISDVGAQSIAHGYLALVIDTAGGGSRTSGNKLGTSLIEALNN
jgi:hypothetical protein